jgi:hypothetical protein
MITGEREMLMDISRKNLLKPSQTGVGWESQCRKNSGVPVWGLRKPQYWHILLRGPAQG